MVMMSINFREDYFKFSGEKKFPIEATSEQFAKTLSPFHCAEIERFDPIVEMKFDSDDVKLFWVSFYESFTDIRTILHL